MGMAAAPTAPPAEAPPPPPPPPPPPVVKALRSGPPPALVPALALGAAALLGRILLGRRRGDAASDGGDAVPEAPPTPSPVLLEFAHVTCTLQKKAQHVTTLLQDVSGSAAPGHLTAIMGPSGAGKTTLLNALAGQLPRAPGLRLTGRVRVNGGSAGSGPSQGYVTQNDEFFAQDSVLETLTLAAQLRLPRRMPAARKHALVAALVAQLGLARVAHSKVGGAKTRGISGGERKRLAIACEMLASPSLLFLDEPTSGLDSFSALSVMQSLKALASRGHTLVASIHQPRGSIWALFDDVILLAEGGAVLYSGPADGAMAHLAQEGLPCPAGSNPAEHLLDVASIDYSSTEAEQASRARVVKLAAAWAARGAASAAGAVVARPEAGAVASAPLPWLQQFRLLLARAWRQATRDTTTLKARLASSLSSAAVFAAVFWRLDRSQASIQSRLGLLQVCAVNTAMSSLVKTLQLFPRERTVVQRERANGHYGVGPYFLAKLAAELPIGAVFPAIFGAAVYPACGLAPSIPRFLKFLGMLTLESFSASAIGMTISALAPSAQAALAIGPATFVIFIVFGGVYVNQTTVPKPLRWIPSTSLIKHSFEGLCLNELRGACFLASQPGDAATGEQVLRRIAFDQSRIRDTLLAQTGILATNWLLTYRILRRRKPKFVAIEDGGSLKDV